MQFVMVRPFINVHKKLLKRPDALYLALGIEFDFELKKYKDFAQGKEFLKEAGYTLIQHPANTRPSSQSKT